MIVVMQAGAPLDIVEELIAEFEEWGLTPEKIVGKHKVVIGLVGDTASLDEARIQELSPFIEQVLRVEKPYKLASLEFRHGECSTVTVGTPNGSGRQRDPTGRRRRRRGRGGRGSPSMRATGGREGGRIGA